MELASTSFLFLGFGAALFYLKLHPDAIRNKTAFFLAWCGFFATIFMGAVLLIIGAYNNASLENLRLSQLWGAITTWILLGASSIALYQALTPLTGKPDKSDRGERAEKSTEPDRRSRRGRAESQRREALEDEPGTDSEDTRARAHTPGMGIRSPSRFGMAIDADKPDLALEAKVDDALDAEPELVLSKDDDLPLEDLDQPLKPVAVETPALPAGSTAINPEPVKVKTVSASISKSRNPAVERPKTEVVRPRTETNPAVKKSGTGIPVAGQPSTSGSRTGIPVTGAGEPVSVPVAAPASRSGKRPSVSGVRPSAKSGIAPKVDEPIDTPSKDQYLDKP